MGEKKRETHAAIYARVSKTNGGQSPESQLRELKAYVKLRGWHVNDRHIFIDRISSKKAKRPALGAMMREARWHHFDAVVCWKYDRIARDAIELLTIVDKLKILKVDFVSKTEQIDTTTPYGYMVVTVLAGVGKLERDHIGQRIRAGLANARAKGVKLGRPLGHKVSVPQVQRLYAQVKSCREVAEKLGISAMTVSRLARKAS
jgi:DNA invertase Pin-like site-specific DNA recombinase